jgi:hypothetical protein
MAISEPTGPFGDDEREEPQDGEPEGVGHEDEFEAEEAAFEPEELPLADEEERLPWLEGDDDEADYGGHSSGQTLALVLVVLLGIALIGAGIWWFTRDRSDADLVADGSVIESEGPYKQRPDDPGGKTFEGTDDASYRVAEGQTAPARLGQGDSPPKPGFDSLEDGSESGSSAQPSGPPANAGASDSSAVGVQVGAFSDRATAEAKWNQMVRQHSALDGVRHRIVEGQADMGTVYRLQALAEDLAGAKSLCSRLRSSGLDCFVKP